MRKYVLLVLLVGLLAIGLAPAQAHTQSAQIDNVFVNGSGQVLAITGRITCTSGEGFLLRVNVRVEDGDSAIGKAGGNCTGSPQQWTTSEEETFGSLETGPAAGHLQARTTPDGSSRSFSDKAQVVSP
jgi:hypothetical protein